jgi:hypothetical protein
MDVRNLRWVGVQTEQYTEMVALLRDVMGLHINFEDDGSIEFTTSEGDQFQIMGPGDPYFEFFGEHAHGPVPLFEVADVRAARSELEGSGVEVIGELRSDSIWEWIHFRGPDGNLYELASRRT